MVPLRVSGLEAVLQISVLGCRCKSPLESFKIDSSFKQGKLEVALHTKGHLQGAAQYDCAAMLSSSEEIHPDVDPKLKI